MRKYIFILSLLLLTQKISAQFIRDTTFQNQELPKKNILKTNPLAIFWGPIPITAEYKISFEHLINTKYSFQIGGSYLGKSFIAVLIEAFDTIPVFYVTKGYRFQIELKYYLNTPFSKIRTPEGFYLAPTYSYAHSKFSDRYLNSKNKYLSFTYTYYCMKFGFQKTYNNLTIELFTGAGYKDNLVLDYTTNKPQIIDDFKDFEIFKGHFTMLLGFNIGWAFD